MSISLTQPAIGSTNWGADVNANWQIIQDALNRAGGFKNKIINGAFNIWQRGVGPVTATDGGYNAPDRFGYEKTGAMIHSVSRSTDVPAVSTTAGATCGLLNYSLLVDCTTIDGSIAAGDYCYIRQMIEGYNILALAQRTFTLSFWVKATKTGIYCVAFRNSGADKSYVAEYTVDQTDHWEKKTITVTASPSSGTWNYTTGIGLRVSWALACGSTYQTTANAWNAGNYLATANQVNACDSTSNDFRLTGVQIECGDTATDFEYVDYATELLKCQRYCQIFESDASVNGPVAIGTAWANNNVAVFVPLAPEMRAIPALTATFSEWQVYDVNNAATALSSISLSAAVANKRCARILAGVAGTPLTPYRPYVLQGDGAAAKILILSAEL